VKLTVDGKSYTQLLTLKMDPRVTTPALGLTQQSRCPGSSTTASSQRRKHWTRFRAKRATLSGDAAAKLQALEGQPGGRGAAADGPDTFNSAIGSMNQLIWTAAGR